MAVVKLTDAADLTAADLIHGRRDALPASATLGEIQRWFAASSHRRLAVLADGGRYAGSLARSDVTGDVDAELPAARLARYEPTVAPDTPASEAHRLALHAGTRRVPVVDGAGRLLGVVAVTEDLSAFCGTG